MEQVTQATQRSEFRLPDQHGRRWHGFVEKRTGDICTTPNATGWRDPLKTNRTKFLSLRSGGDDFVQRMYVDWDAWIDQVTNDEQEWYRHLRECGRLAYKKMDKVPDVTADLENDPYVREIAGPKPWPSSVVLKAAKNGDKQYLGLAELDDAHREALGLPLSTDQRRAATAPAKVSGTPKAEVPTPKDGETYQEFVARAAEAWKKSKTAA